MVDVREEGRRWAFRSANKIGGGGDVEDEDINIDLERLHRIGVLAPHDRHQRPRFTREVLEKLGNFNAFNFFEIAVCVNVREWQLNGQFPFQIIESRRTALVFLLSSVSFSVIVRH